MSHRLICSAGGSAVRRTAPHAVVAAWMVLAALVAVPGTSLASSPPGPSPDPAPATSAPQPDAAPVRAVKAPARSAPSTTPAERSAPAPQPARGTPAAATQATTTAAPRTTPTRRRTHRKTRRARTAATRSTARAVPSVSAGIVPPRLTRLVRMSTRHDSAALARGGLVLLALALAGAALLDRSVRVRRGPVRG